MCNLSYADVIISTEVILNFGLYREFFRALANQTRFSIVQLLRKRPYYVNEMVERLGIEQSRVSHNLACLLNCGFVEWQWNGKNKVYRLNPDLHPVLVGIDKHLMKYAPALESCQTLKSESKPIVILAKSNDPETLSPTKRRRRK
jgi:predicted transcriptional regulator